MAGTFFCISEDAHWFETPVGPSTWSRPGPCTDGGIHWDLTALLNAAHAPGSRVERHLWLVHLLEWLRHEGGETPRANRHRQHPWPVRRLRHLLNVLDRHPEHRLRVSTLLRDTLAGLDAPGLLADFGFAPRHGFFSELADRLRLNFLPGTPETRDLGELFLLIFDDERDPEWIAPSTTARCAACWPCAPRTRPPALAARADRLDRAAGQPDPRQRPVSALRQRMDPAGLGDRPFTRWSRPPPRCGRACPKGPRRSSCSSAPSTCARCWTPA
jgi:hypothetical protein